MFLVSKNHLFVASSPVDFGSGIAGGFTAESGYSSLFGRNSRLSIDNLGRSSSSHRWPSGDRWVRIQRKRTDRHTRASTTVEAALVVSLTIGIRATLFLAISPSGLSALDHRAASFFRYCSQIVFNNSLIFLTIILLFCLPGRQVGCTRVIVSVGKSPCSRTSSAWHWVPSGHEKPRHGS